MPIPTSNTNPSTPGRTAHTIVISVTYDEPVTDDTIATFREVVSHWEGISSYAVLYGAKTRKEGVRHNYPAPRVGQGER